MRISIIIPVYNAARFVEQAVASALAQPETGEVLLIEDGSEDTSLTICTQLAHDSNQVRLIQHPGGKNRGASASRNLGIALSRCEYVSFLDADDFYAPSRFAVTRQVFASIPNVDGVYEAVGVYYDNQEIRRERRRLGIGDTLISISESIPPDQLLQALSSGGFGTFCIIGLTARREVFSRVGYFDEHLSMHEDTVLLMKMATQSRLAPGEIRRPVAFYRMHAGNRYLSDRPFRKTFHERLASYRALMTWSQTLDSREQQALLLQYILRFTMYVPQDRHTVLGQGLHSRIRLLLILSHELTLITKAVFWRLFLPSPGMWKANRQLERELRRGVTQND